MTKREFVRQCAASTDLSQRQVNDVLKYYHNAIIDELFENDVSQCFGLGKLKLVHKKSNPHYNFQTGEIQQGREYIAVKYTPTNQITQRCRRRKNNG